MANKVLGLRGTLRALKQIEPDLEKQLRSSINKSAADVVKTARGYVAGEDLMRGWSPDGWRGGWNPAEVRRGIKRENLSTRHPRGGFVQTIAVSNLTAAGMIYELAGSKSKGRTPQGAQFIRNIAKYPGSLKTPLRRLVVRAGVEKGPEAKRAVEDAMKTAQRVTQRRLDNVRGR